MFLLIVKLYFGFLSVIAYSVVHFGWLLKRGKDNRELARLDDQKLEAAAYNTKVAS